MLHHHNVLVALLAGAIEDSERGQKENLFKRLKRRLQIFCPRRCPKRWA